MLQVKIDRFVAVKRKCKKSGVQEEIYGEICYHSRDRI